MHWRNNFAFFCVITSCRPRSCVLWESTAICGNPPRNLCAFPAAWAADSLCTRVAAEFLHQGLCWAIQSRLACCSSLLQLPEAKWQWRQKDVRAPEKIIASYYPWLVLLGGLRIIFIVIKDVVISYYVRAMDTIYNLDYVLAGTTMLFVILNY